MPDKQLTRALEFLTDTPTFDGWSTKPEGSHFDIVLSDRILKYQGLFEVIDEMRAERRPAHSQPKSYTADAARAVCEAIENLTAAGQRAYVRNGREERTLSIQLDEPEEANLPFDLNCQKLHMQLKQI